jgi:hypothetical protein
VGLKADRAALGDEHGLEQTLLAIDVRHRRKVLGPRTGQA